MWSEPGETLGKMRFGIFIPGECSNDLDENQERGEVSD